MPFLLDTNAWIRYLRDPNSPVRARLATHAPREIKFCSVVLAELYRGALRSHDPIGQWAVIDALAAPYESFPFDDRAAAAHSRIRVPLERQGRLIGPHDLLIASIALANQFTLVSHNVGEFSRVPGLSIEDWEQP